MAHPATTRQQARISAAAETINLPAPVYYSHDPNKTGTSAYGPLRKSLVVHVEGAAGNQSGTNQIATQDQDVAQALLDASKSGMVTKIGALL